jgi:hypothetical protein
MCENTQIQIRDLKKYIFLAIYVGQEVAFFKCWIVSCWQIRYKSKVAFAFGAHKKEPSKHNKRLVKLNRLLSTVVARKQ